MSGIAARVIRIPRQVDPTKDEPQSTALAIVDRYCDEFKRLCADVDFGAVAIEATLHAGRIVKMDVTRRIKLDVSAQG